ncbi:unnamed protein product, partial [Didymodactylos carnosus]
SLTVIDTILPLIHPAVVDLKIDRFLFVGKSFFQQFPSLKYLTLQNMTEEIIKQLRPYFSSFKRLLKVQFVHGDHRNYWLPNDFIKEIIQQNCSLKEAFLAEIEPLTRDTVAKLTLCSNLTVLQVNLEAGRDLLTLLHYLPQIQSVTCISDSEIKMQDFHTAIAPTSSLQKLDLEFLQKCNLNAIFYLLKSRLSLIDLSLKSQINMKYNERAIDGNRLKNELLQHLIALKTFKFSFIVSMEWETAIVPDTSAIIKTFNNDFYLKEHDWKVGAFQEHEFDSYHLFSLPYAYSDFDPCLTNKFVDFDTINCSLPLPSGSFNEVTSATVNNYIWRNSLPLLQYIKRNFINLKELEITLKVDDLDELKVGVGDYVNRLKEIVGQQLQFPKIKQLDYNARYFDFQHIYILFPNLIELKTTMKHVLICTNELKDQGQFFLKFKHLKRVEIYEAEHTGEISGEEEKNSIKYFGHEIPIYLAETHK